MANSSGEQLLFDGLFELYDKLVNEVITHRLKDERYICQLLDDLMDYSFHNGMLFLFRTLIRYYLNLNEPVALHYIDKYNREYGNEMRIYYDETKS